MCEENINVIAQGEDVPIAYCVLDVNDSIHYLRITKSIVAEEDAYDLIRNPNNLSYNYVEAYLNEFVNDNYVQTFSFERSEIAEKDSGLFPFVPNSIYQLNARLNHKAKYELHINIPDVDTLVANTSLVQPFRINDVRIIYISEIQPFFIRWTSPVNGKYYEIKCNIICLEIMEMK